MSRRTLSETLTALALGAAPDHPHLVVEEAEISLPLLVRMEAGPDGLRFHAQPPWSAYRSGVEPVAHRARLRLGTLAVDAGEHVRPAAERSAPAHPASACAAPATRAAPEPAG
jgi:hypothetical protein